MDTIAFLRDDQNDEETGSGGSRRTDCALHCDAAVMLRGQKVLLDADLATLYGVETRVLVQAVKRSPGRFPEDFMFQLTTEEAAFKITNCDLKGRARSAP